MPVRCLVVCALLSLALWACRSELVAIQTDAGSRPVGEGGASGSSNDPPGPQVDGSASAGRDAGAIVTPGAAGSPAGPRLDASVTSGAGGSMAGGSGTGAGSGVTPGVAGAAGTTTPACVPVETTHAVSWSHVQVCDSIVTWNSDPPNSGQHYGSPADWKEYRQPVPWGFVVHSLEHGGVAFAYNCPTGCPNELERLREMLSRLPPDPDCAAGPVRHRVLVMPDPKLPVRFAAVAAGATLTSNCFDPDAFREFYLQRRGRSGAEERLCTRGVDREFEGWCGEPPAR